LSDAAKKQTDRQTDRQALPRRRVSERGNAVLTLTEANDPKRPPVRPSVT